MNSVVLDASALITMLNQESGADMLTPEILLNAVSSTVNLAEVQSKLVSRGLPPEAAWRATLHSVREAISFTPEHAKTALVKDLLHLCGKHAPFLGEQCSLADTS